MEERPKPFSSDWISAPPSALLSSRRLPPRVARVLASVGRRLPGERALSIIVVLVLVLVSLGFAGPGSDAHRAGPPDDGGAQLAAANINENDATPPSTPSPTPPPTLAIADAKPTTPPTISTEPITVTDGAAATTTPGTPTAPKLKIKEPAQQADADGGLLPKYRILTYYGFPGDNLMGILGEYDKDTLLAKLQDEARAYEDADPSRPVKIGFEVIASVAQHNPQEDNSYIADASTQTLDEYVKFAGEHDILLFFDVQFGRRTTQDEVKSLEPWLKKPFVHLALDPEFKMREGEIPGQEIGQIDASDITWTQNYLAELSKKYNIPPKVLIVHQFHYTMIENKDQLAPVAGVQLVIDSDGWGTPDQKRDTYGVVNTQAPIQYDGIKLFYKQDVPMMTPKDVVKLDPAPNVVIYQ